MSAELNQLYSSLSSINREFDSFSKILSANSKSTNLVDQAFRATANSAALQKAAQQALSNSISNAANSLTSFAKSLANGTGSFEPLTTVISTVSRSLGSVFGQLPILGGALKGLIEGAGTVAVAIVQQFDKTYGTFEKLSDVGIVTTFGDLKHSAQMMNLSIADTEIVMTKHSKDMALWGSSALDGRKQFEQIAYSTAGLKLDFQKLGIGSKEFSDMQASYINQRTRLSQGQTRTTQQLADGSISYMKQLDALAKLTGASRKTIQTEREARMNDASFRASMSELGPDLVENIQSGLDIVLHKGSKELEEGLRNVVSTEGTPTNDAGKAFALAMETAGMNVAETVTKLRNGTLKFPEMIDQMRASGKLNIEKFKELAKNSGDQTMATKLYVGLSNLVNGTQKTTRSQLSEINALQNDTIDDTESQNAQLASTKQNMENLQKTMEQMATESKLVTGLLESMSEGLLDMTGTIAGYAGVTLNPVTDAVIKSARATSDAKQALSDTNDAIDRSLTEKGLREARILKTQASHLAGTGTTLSREEALKKNLIETEKLAEEARRNLARIKESVTLSSTPGVRTASAGVGGGNGSSVSIGASPVGANSTSSSGPSSGPSSPDEASNSSSTGSSTATATSGPVAAGGPDGVTVAPLNPMTVPPEGSTPNMLRETLAGVVLKLNTLSKMMHDYVERDRREVIRNGP